MLKFGRKFSQEQQDPLLEDKLLDDVLWTCKAAHPMAYEVGNKKRKRKVGPIPDSYLRPIREEPLGMDIAVGVVIQQMRREQEEEVAKSSPIPNWTSQQWAILA